MAECYGSMNTSDLKSIYEYQTRAQKVVNVEKKQSSCDACCDVGDLLCDCESPCCWCTWLVVAGVAIWWFFLH